ncbi:MAG TPA: hypothetical protein VF142_15930 [Longimicrobium sp.]
MRHVVQNGIRRLTLQPRDPEAAEALRGPGIHQARGIVPALVIERGEECLGNGSR